MIFYHRGNTAKSQKLTVYRHQVAAEKVIHYGTVPICFPVSMAGSYPYRRVVEHMLTSTIRVL